MTGNHSFVANFEAQTVEIKVSVDPIEGGTAEGEGSYHYGEMVTLTVALNDEYRFLN